MNSDIITDELLAEFKDRMKISHSAEDESLKKLLFESYEELQDMCGEFSLETSVTGKGLVMERSRYVYNDATEFFEANFKAALMRLGFKNYLATRSTPDGGEEV